jgi:hypothetical protein
VQKALAGLRRIDLERLRWLVCDTTGLFCLFKNCKDLLMGNGFAVNYFVYVVGAWTVGIPNCCQLQGKDKPIYAPPVENGTCPLYSMHKILVLQEENGLIKFTTGMLG